MNKRNRLGLAALALLFIGAMVYAEVKVIITNPTVTFNTANTDLNAALNNLFKATTGAEFQTAITSIQTSAEKQLAPYANQDKMALGFANANVAAAQSATMQGYQGYKIFAITSGVMIGGQLPSITPSELTGLATTISTNPNIKIGVEPSIAFLNVGVNTGKLIGIFNKDLGDSFIFKNLYLTGKFGMLNSPNTAISYSGLTLNAW